jgi:hypothetical protein
MPGVLSMLLGFGGGANSVGNLTVGTTGVSSGFLGDLSIGSMSPNVVIPNGAGGTQNITRAYADSTHDFVIVSTGATLSQSVFNRCVVADGTGALRTYTTASATFSTSSGVNTWSWGTGSNRVYSSGDNGEAHACNIFF